MEQEGVLVACSVPSPDRGRLMVQIFTALSISYQCCYTCKANQYALKPTELHPLFVIQSTSKQTN